MAETVRSPSPSSNWAGLHRDLIDSILDRLILLSDLVRFSAACKSWNCMGLNHYKEKRIQEINHQLPWLVRQPGQEKDYSLYDVSSSKLCNFQFQIPFLHRESHCCVHHVYPESSHGWFFVWDGTAIKMINPISGTMFGLPPFMNGKGICTPKRVTLSRDPSICLTSPFEVLACSCTSDRMAHWKSGDKFWSYSQYKRQFRFQDFIFYKDRMLGIAIKSYMFQPVVDLIGIENNQATAGGGIKIKWIASTPIESGICVEGYLVETTKGDLLMVLQCLGTNNICLPFRVNKLIIGANNDWAKIIPITNLDGESLFLGENNHSISVLASDYPGCIPNSIYNSILCGYVSVFNLKDGCVSNCSSPTPYMKFSVTPWIVPSMKLL